MVGVVVKNVHPMGDHSAVSDLNLGHAVEAGIVTHIYAIADFDLSTTAGIQNTSYNGIRADGDILCRSVIVKLAVETQ